MTSRERVLTTLKGEKSDRVPFCEQSIAQNVVMAIAGQSDELSEKEISRLLNRDNIAFDLTPPIFARREVSQEGQEYFTEGLIQKRDDLKLMKFPDPKGKELIKSAREFAKDKEDFAAAASIRLGISPVLNSMGIEGFSFALVEDRELVEEVLQRYTNWTIAVLEWANEIGFDLFWSFDDIAFRTGPFVSPAMFRELFIPRVKKVAEKITLPWIYHSDGNILPILDDLLTLGMSGLHPIEPEAMDIEKLKRDYGNKICLIGNISVDNLSRKNPEDIEKEVKHKIEVLSPGGGYIVSSSNSIPSYAKPENLKAMAKAIQEFGRYPIKV